MTVTVTDIEAGPFVATGAAQTVSYPFMTPTAVEIDVFFDVGNGRVLIDPMLYVVRPARTVTGKRKEGGSVELASGAAPSGSDLYLVSAPLLTRDIVWSNQGSLLDSLNEEQDRDALRWLKSRADFGRALKVPSGEVGFALPNINDRAGKFLAFDESGGFRTDVRPEDFDAFNKANKDGSNLSPDFAEKIPYAGWSVADEFNQVIYAARYKTPFNDWEDAIEAAADAANISGPTLIVLPSGNLFINRTIWVKSGRTVLQGQGNGSTVIYAMFGDKDIVRFKHPTEGSSYLASIIRGASLVVHPIYRPATAGAAVAFDGVGECEANDVTFIGTYDGIDFRGNNRNCRTNNCGGSDVVNSEFRVRGGGNQHIRLGTGFDNTGVAACGFLIEETERTDLDFATSSHHVKGILIKPLADQTVQNVFSSFGDYDAAGSVGVSIEATNNGAVVRNIMFSGGSAGSAATTVGLNIEQAGTGVVGDVWFSNCFIQANLKEGAKLAAGRVHMNGVHVGNNGVLDGSAGIRLMAGLEFFQMNGGTSGQLLGGANKSDRPMAWQNHQQYGIVIDSGFDGTALLTGVDLRNNINGPIQNNSTSATLIADNCLGYVTRIAGTATIASGTNIKIQSHNMGVAPRVVMASANAGNCPYPISITADATNLAVYTSENTTSAVTVSYILER